jgi:O-Antigen ligase
MDCALYRFSRLTGQILVLNGVLLLFLPKLNVVDLQAGSGAGLRIDDVLLLSCFMFFASVLLYYCSAVRLRKIELAFAGWMLALLISNVLNVTFHGRSSYLYSLRFIEYFLFFYFGYYFAQRYELRTLAKATLWVNGTIMVLQMFHVVGGFASAGYSPRIGRPIGLTGGPWEIGVLINFCLAIFLFSGNVSTKAAVKSFLITSALLLLTGSRMAMLAQLAIIIAFYRHQGHNVLSVLWKSSIAVAVLAAAVYFIPNSLQARSQKLFDVENLHYLQQMYERTPDNPSLDQFYDFEVQDDSDMSWVMRVSKWCVAIKLWMRDSTSPIFGVGPGGIGIALDGGWLRIVIESGVLGLITFLALARSIWCISPTLRVMLLAIAINMLMIDIYLAYKVMAFLFFTAGYFIFRNERASRRVVPHAHPDRLLMVKI